MHRSLLLTCAALLTSSPVVNGYRRSVKMDIDALGKESVEMNIDALGNEAETTSTPGNEAETNSIPGRNTSKLGLRLGADSLLSLANDSGVEAANRTGSLEAQAKISSPPALSTSIVSFGEHPCDVCFPNVEHASDSTFNLRSAPLDWGAPGFSPNFFGKLEAWVLAHPRHVFWTYSVSVGCPGWQQQSRVGRAVDHVAATLKGEEEEANVAVSVEYTKRMIVRVDASGSIETLLVSNVLETRTVVYTATLGNFTADSQVLQLYKDGKKTNMGILLVWFKASKTRDGRPIPAGCVSGLGRMSDGEQVNFLRLAKSELKQKASEKVAHITDGIMAGKQEIQVAQRMPPAQDAGAARPRKKTYWQGMIDRFQRPQEVEGGGMPIAEAEVMSYEQARAFNAPSTAIGVPLNY